MTKYKMIQNFTKAKCSFNSSLYLGYKIAWINQIKKLAKLTNYLHIFNGIRIKIILKSLKLILINFFFFFSPAPEKGKGVYLILWRSLDEELHIFPFLKKEKSADHLQF